MDVRVQESTTNNNSNNNNNNNDNNNTILRNQTCELTMMKNDTKS